MLRLEAGEAAIALLGSAPDRLAIERALAALDDELHAYVAHHVTRRWPRIVLPILLPYGDVALLDRLVHDPALSLHPQPPMSKLVRPSSPLEIEKVRDGTRLVVHGDADDDVVDAVIAAVGSALSELHYCHERWSERAWRRLDRSALRRLHCAHLENGKEMARFVLDGAYALEQLTIDHKSLDDDRVPSGLRELVIEADDEEVLRPALAEAIGGCRSLETLRMDVTVSEASIAAIASAPLVELVLWHASIGDEGARALARCRTLEELWLHGGTIGDDGATALASLPISQLHLDRNRVGARGATAIAAMTSLDELSLDDNLVDDEGAAALSRLRGLRALSLRGNRFADPEALRVMLAPVAREVSLVVGDRTDSFGGSH